MRRRESVCVSGESNTGTCFLRGTQSISSSPAVRSIQDTVAPTLDRIELAGGARFTRSLRIDVDTVQRDIGAGAGFFQLSSSPTFDCPPQRRSLCVNEGVSTQFALSQGPDGPRIVYGRVFDRARGPSDGPGTTVFGLPPGNVSVARAATITVDRLSPAVVISFSSTQAQAGSAVTMNGSASRDSAGFGADSGLDVDSGRWSFGDGTTASGLVAAHAYGQPGTYRGSFSVADQAGNQTTAEFSIEVVADPVAATPGTSDAPPTTTPETVDRTAPRLQNVALRRRGTRASLTFRLSERATVAVEVVRVSPAPTWRVAAFTRVARAGRGQVVLPSRALARRGTYRIRLVARDEARNASAPRTLTVRRR